MLLPLYFSISLFCLLHLTFPAKKYLTHLWDTSPFRHSSFVPRETQEQFQQSTSDTSLGVFDKLTLTDTECQIQLVKYTKWGAWSSAWRSSVGEEKNETQVAIKANTIENLHLCEHKGDDFTDSPLLYLLLPRRCSEPFLWQQPERRALRSPSQWWHCAQDGPFDH